MTHRVGYTRQEEAVYSLLARTGGEWYVFEIVNALASTQAVVREALNGLVNHGWVLDRICGEEYRYHACYADSPMRGDGGFFARHRAR